MTFLNQNFYIFFQNPFQRLVKRMTRFHTKKSADKTLYKLKEVLDALKYNFTVNSPRQVRKLPLERFCLHVS